MSEERAGPGGGGAPVRWFLLFAVPLVVAAAVVVHLAERAAEPSAAQPWDDDARREIQAVVETRYADAVDRERAEELFDAAMRGYVEGLDAFSRYYPASERPSVEQETTGQFGGIGVRVDAVPAGLLVVAVRRGGPADAAGIVPGDTIEEAAGRALAGRDRDAMVDLIKGEPGSVVELSVRPAAGGAPRAARVERAVVDVGTVVAARLVPGEPPVGYLRIAQFSDTTPAEAREALAGLVRDGARAVVLDLRHNLGGVVGAAVGVAALFTPPGTLVCASRSRDGARPYRTEPAAGGAAPCELPLAVLVDAESASASEILAGALQDLGRAALVGERTYGKFVLQTVIPLRNRGALLRITTARYETPRGRSSQRDPARGVRGGLQPDVRVPLASSEEEVALRAAFARHAGPGWLVLDGRDGASEPPDRQLAAALDLVRGGPAPAEPVRPRPR